MRNFLLSCLVLVTINLQAQIISGPRAAGIIPDAAALRYDGNQSLPQYIRLLPGTERSMDNAPAFLRTYLQLPAKYNFELMNSETDQYGIEHRRYKQTVDGHPVLGGTYIFHGRNGSWYEANGELFLPDEATATVLITPDQAIAAALDALPSALYGWETDHPVAEYPEPRLTWAPKRLEFQPGNFRLTYEVYVYSLDPVAHERFFVDATTGQVIAAESQMHTISDQPAVAQTRLSGERTIMTTQVDSSGIYVLRETGRGQGIETYNAATLTALPFWDFEDNDNYWQNVNAQRDEIATDCHWAAEMYYDFMLTLGRNSIDNEGEVLESHVHHDVNWANASWDGRRARFGDGRSGSGLSLPTTTIDIVAHEFTHGFTDRTSDLIYQNEFGALNESFSDIFGIATSYWARPEKFSWQVGPEATLDGMGIRSMSDPNSMGDPDTYRGDRWVDGAGVHINSGVQNHWFYLLTEGGTGVNELGTAYDISALGMDRAIEVAYRNNAFYLTETSVYNDAGFNAMLAAAAAFGSCSDEVLQVVEAWKAVGVTVEIPEMALAGFRVDGPFCELNTPVTFLNTSFGNSYLWTFGDGTSSTEQNPTHVYQTPGAYDVSLQVEGCNGDVAIVTIPAAVIIDPENIFCDFDIMPEADTVTINDCRGVLYDSGGPNGNYTSNEASLITIENPNGGPVTLTLNAFRTELFSDRMFIYDGNSTDAPELAVLSGNVQRDPITSSGSSITILWSSNSGGTDRGWEIVWGDNPSNSAPDAAFLADETDPLLNAPVTFSPDVNLPGPLTYDFGDGSPAVFVDGPITHIYDTPGSYQVSAIDQNCSSADTAFLSINVQEGTRFAVSPSAISDTLFVGETAQHEISISNLGDRTGFYSANLPPFANTNLSSALPFSVASNQTYHLFDDLPESVPSASLTIMVQGDYEGLGEFAEITVEGQVVGSLGQSSIPSELTLTLEPSATELANWLADGQIEVFIENTIQVSPVGITSLHTVVFSYANPAFMTGPVAAEELLDGGESTNYQLTLDATNTLPGLYTEQLNINSSDSLTANLEVPVSLLVLGRPIPDYSALSIDFGFPLVSESVSRELRIQNIGTAPFDITEANIDNPLFISDLSPTTLAPNETVDITLDFTGAMSLGQQQATLTVNTTAGDQAIDLVAVVSTPPVANISTEVLAVTLPSGTTRDTSIAIENTSTTPLIYRIDQGQFRETSEEFFTDEVDTTAHLFSNIPASNLPYSLAIVLQGDFSSPAERTKLFLDGEDQGFLPDRNLPDNTPDTIYVEVAPSFLTDNELMVVLDNSGGVGFDEDLANRHEVQLFQSASVDWIELPAVFPPLIGPSIDNPSIHFNAVGLNAGVYFSSLAFNSSDPLIGEQLIPVRMTVTGAPSMAVDRDTLDFGPWQRTTATSTSIEITNTGTDTLVIDELVMDDINYQIETTDLRIPPGLSQSLEIEFNPENVGQINGTLTLNGPRVAPREIVLRGIGIGAADSEFAQDSICLSLLMGQDTSFQGLTVNSIGDEPLHYDFGSSAGQLLVWTYAVDLDVYNQNVSPILSDLETDFTLTETATTQANEMLLALTVSDVLLIPNPQQPDPAVLAAMRTPLRQFVARGGRIIVTGGAEGEIPLGLDLLDATFVQSNPGGLPIRAIVPEHPIFEGLGDSLTSADNTTFLVNANVGSTVTLARMFGNPTIATRELGLGEVIFLGYTYQTINEDNNRVLRNALQYAKSPNPLPSWLDIDPIRGMLQGGGSTDHTITVNTNELLPGVYYHTVRLNSNDPSVVDDRTFVVKLTVQLDTEVTDAAAVDLLNLYPNPSQGLLYLDIELGISQGVHWDIIDQAGRQLTHGHFFGSQRQFPIDLSRLPAAGYQLRLLNDRNQLLATRKVFLQ